MLFINLELFCHYLLRVKQNLLLFLHQLKISLLNFGKGNRLVDMWFYLFERNSMDCKFLEALILRLFIFLVLFKSFQTPLRHKTKHWRQLFTLRLLYLRNFNIKRISRTSHKFLLNLRKGQFRRLRRWLCLYLLMKISVDLLFSFFPQLFKAAPFLIFRFHFIIEILLICQNTTSFLMNQQLHKINEIQHYIWKSINSESRIKVVKIKSVIWPRISLGQVQPAQASISYYPHSRLPFLGDFLVKLKVIVSQLDLSVHLGLLGIGAPIQAKGSHYHLYHSSQIWLLLLLRPFILETIFFFFAYLYNRR